MKKNSGFTLVELAIVIVIIGLLVAGVLVGKDLVEQAKVRSVIKQFGEYETAVIIFNDKYKCLPGDCKNASTVLGSAASNGDGNGQISITLIDPEELLFVWQHLGLAKLIKGSYTGLNTARLNSDIGVNVPKVDGYEAGYWLFSRAVGVNLWSGTSNFGIANRHALAAGSPFQNRLFDGFMAPASAYQIDTKLDDGNPATGVINVGNGHNMKSGCTLPANGTAWDGSLPTSYDFSSNKANCTVFKWENF